MARFQPMTTSVTRGEDGQGRDVIVVSVVHDIRQSFTKAVDPAAKRRMRAEMARRGIRHASLIDGHYGQSIIGESGRCSSDVVFEVVA